MGLVFQKTGAQTMYTMPLHLIKPNPAAPKVLHVRVIANSGGGPDKTIIRSGQYLDPMRYHMQTAYIYPSGSKDFQTFKKQAVKHRCQLIEIPESGPFDFSTYKSLLKICQDQKIDIWHGHDYKSNLLGLLIARKCPRLKLVTTVHGWTGETWRTKLYTHVDHYCLKRYDEVVVVSPKLYEHCRDTLKIDSSKLTYIPNAIRPEEYPQTHTQNEARKELDFQTGRKVIGVVGRLSIEKGVDRAIDMIAKLPGCELHLIGDGPERKNLEKQAVDLGIADRVRFWGWQTASQMFYQSMDMLLLPSHTEGLPNVVLEAMTMTIPVAATDVGGVRDLLDDGRCGMILPTEQPAAWANMIQNFLADEDQLQQTALLARQRILTHFTFESRMQRMMRVYDKLGLKSALPKQKAA
jgi:glycosyltransferase involved in cell wall biosynthesis